MDPYNESRHHPSESIPNAAYPDAPYRPGEGQQDARVSPSSHTSPAASFPSPVSHHSHSSPWSHDVAQPSPDPGMPDVPPPPYAPPQRQSGASPSLMGHPHAIPLQTLQPVTSAGSSHIPIYHHHQGSQPGIGYYTGAPASQSPFAPYVVTSGGPGSTMSGKMYPAGRESRLRRRRKVLLLCILFGGLTTLVLIVGLWFGVYNRNNDDNDDDGGRFDFRPSF